MAPASRPEDHRGKRKHFSFIGDLKQRASEALGSGNERVRPASAMDIRVIREGEAGGVPSGVNMDLVPLHQTAPIVPLKKKPSRADMNFSVSLEIHQHTMKLPIANETVQYLHGNLRRLRLGNGRMQADGTRSWWNNPGRHLPGRLSVCLSLTQPPLYQP